VSPKNSGIFTLCNPFFFSFFQVIFEAQKGLGYLGDIAIDQITFTREKCILVPSSASPNASANSLIGEQKRFRNSVSMLCSIFNSGFDYLRNLKNLIGCFFNQSEQRGCHFSVVWLQIKISRHWFVLIRLTLAFCDVSIEIIRNCLCYWKSDWFKTVVSNHRTLF